jgi:hypothetical protein
MDQVRKVIEATAEIVAKGRKQMMYLHASNVPHPEAFEEWVPKSGAYKPGFYEVDANAVYVKQEVNPGTKGGHFVNSVLRLGGLRFISEKNPLEVPAVGAAPLGLASRGRA